MITITVYGTPAPQGSKHAFAVRGKGGVPTGKIGIIESSHDRVKSWRQAVIEEAESVKPGIPLDGPLSVRMIFYLKRPKGHYGTGRNATQVRDSAPRYPAGTPDLSKLARSTEDALTAVGLWSDDARVVQYTELAKYWCSSSHPQAGAVIEITSMTEAVFGEDELACLTR